MTMYHDTMTYDREEGGRTERRGKGQIVGQNWCGAKRIDDITKGKTLGANGLNEGAVGFSICVLVGGGEGVGREGGNTAPQNL